MEKKYFSKSDLAIVKVLLDLFHELTGEIVAFYDSVNDPIWCGDSPQMAPLCAYSKSNPEIWAECEADHNERSSQHYHENPDAGIENICHLGLCNYSIPVTLDDIFYGSLIIGQKRSSEYDDQSNSKFEIRVEQLIKTGSLNPMKAKVLREKQNDVQLVPSLKDALKIKLEWLERAIEGLLENVHTQVKDAADEMILVRHELHHPVTNMKNRMLRLISILEDNIKEHTADNLKVQTLEIIKAEVKYSQKQSEIFSNTIENVTESFGKGQRGLDLKETNLIQLITESRDVFEYEAGDKGVVLEKVDAIGLVYKKIQCDRTLLRRALINIYQNAVKYSYSSHSGSRNRSIKTTVRTVGTLMELRVSNFGIGILEQEIKEGSIWIKGERGLLSSDMSRTGSGIGLSMIKDMVERHCGSVEISSEPQTPDMFNGPYLTTLSLRLPFFQNTTANTNTKG